MVDWIVRCNPTSILDVGVGFGKWGFLAREYTDVNAQRYTPDTWSTRIDGIEAFRGYTTPLYSYAYNSVFYGDALDLVHSLGPYDLAILGDVIEHWEKEPGRRLLAELCTKARYILISSPTVFFQQSLFDNPYEAHRSLWAIEDFSAFDFDYDEYSQWVFVAMLRGTLAKDGIRLDSTPARLVYSRPWLRKHPALADIVKRGLTRIRTRV